MRQPEALAAQPHITIATAGQEQGLSGPYPRRSSTAPHNHSNCRARAGAVRAHTIRREFRTNRRPRWGLRREQGCPSSRWHTRGRIPSVASSARTEGPGGAFVVSRTARAADGMRPDSPPGSPLTDAARDRESPRCGPDSRTAYRYSRTYGGRRSASPGCGCRNAGTPTPTCRRPPRS